MHRSLRRAPSPRLLGAFVQHRSNRDAPSSVLAIAAPAPLISLGHEILTIRPSRRGDPRRFS
jgi:hypothetical protein